MKMKTLKRRRKENKTDYKLRLGLLKSGIPRIVIRRTNKYFIVQVVESSEAKDRVKLTVNSKELLKNGWDKKKSGSLKSIPAGYLTGKLLSKKIGKGKYIIDLGLARTIHGSRIYSVVKGLIDGGLDISVGKDVFPKEEKIKGEHINEEIKKIVSNMDGKL